MVDGRTKTGKVVNQLKRKTLRHPSNTVEEVTPIGGGIIPNHSGVSNHPEIKNNFYTQTESDNKFVNITGDTMTGDLSMGSNDITNINNLDGSGALDWDGSAVFNESGLDKDFRVEGLNEANLLFVDAGNDAVRSSTTGDTNLLYISDGTGGGTSAEGTISIGSTNSSRAKLYLEQGSPTDVPGGASVCSFAGRDDNAAVSKNVNAMRFFYQRIGSGSSIVTGKTFGANATVQPVTTGNITGEIVGVGALIQGFAQTNNQTVSKMKGGSFRTVMTTAGTFTNYDLTDSYSVFADEHFRAEDGTTDNAYNVYCVAHRKSEGTITNAYGLYLEDQTAGTNNWAIKTNLGNVEFGDDTFWTGEGSGLPFGEIYAYESGTTQTISGSGIANKVQVTVFDTNGESNLTTPDHTNDHITINKAGKYIVTVSMSLESAGGSSYVLSAGVWKNNGATQYQNVHMSRRLSGGGSDVGSTSMSGICDFAANDTVELWIWNETNTNNVIIDDVTLSIVHIGGT